MIKIKFSILFLFLSTSALSFAREVKITSFNFTGSRNSTAEICGRVSGEAGLMDIVDITADPGDKNPGSYVVILSKEGKFCAVINTLTGKADATLRGESKKSKAFIKSF